MALPDGEAGLLGNTDVCRIDSTNPLDGESEGSWVEKYSAKQKLKIS